jgi:pimeloyl-ACP methyl ester carboxylesterase
MWIHVHLLHFLVLVGNEVQFGSHGVVEAFGDHYSRLGVRQTQLFISRNILESDGPWASFSLLPSNQQSTGSVTPVDPPQLRPHNVQFMAPLLDYGHPPTVEELENGTLTEKPLLLYLPGFDGTYICPFIQFPELGTEFELWCMTVGMSDRSTFAELKACVLDFINQFDVAESTSDAIEPSTNVTKAIDSQKTGTGQPFWSSWFSNELFNPSTRLATSDTKQKRSLYLVGESFGGILASDIALTIMEEGSEATFDLKGLVLINPATCYDRSQLAAKGPPITKLPTFLYPFGLSTLLPLFTDAFSFEQLLLILQAKALPSVIDNPIRESYMGRVAFSLPTKLEYMAQDTLTWRLEEWLNIGCEMMEDRIRDFREYKSFRTLLLVGEKDMTLPSIAEAERLANLLPNSQVHVVEGAGHASTCGSRLDLAAQIRRTFVELREDGPDKTKTSKVPNRKRVAMKSDAAAGIGPYFGMEPRYDGATIGLNPIKYWARSNYRPMQAAIEERSVTLDDNNGMRTEYRKVLYQLRPR